jgi:hypothetical protein
LPTIAYRGWLAGVELAAHGIVAALAAAAGLALMNGSAPAARLATAAIVLSVLRTAQALYASVLPHDVSPGQQPVILAVTAIVALAAILIVRRPPGRIG